jgi:pimeloyl-ACP methyl ester carboxylesterase
MHDWVAALVPPSTKAIMTRIAYFLLLFALFSTPPAQAQSGVAGTWEGAIVLPGINLGITVHLKGQDTDLKGTIDIPMQMARGLPLKNIKLMDSLLHFELPAGPGLASFEGRVRGDSVRGDFHQGNVASTFYLGRTAPAEPEIAAVPPPYRQEEVMIQNGDIMLAGTLTTPQGKGPYPGVVLLTGSGAQNRDEEIFGFTPFKILADTLTRSGFAVLRCDDRGVGGSTGSTATSTTADLAGDALAMRTFLAGRRDVDSMKTGFLGHSEGAMVAVMAAAQSRTVAFIVLLAGPSIRGDSLILYQLESLGKAQGASDEDIRRGMALERRALATAKRGEGWDELRTLLSEEMRRDLDRMTPEQRAAFTDSVVSARVEMQMDALRTPWFRSFIVYDPAVDLRKVTCPVLALFAELDKQVPPLLNRKPMEQAFKAGGNGKVEFATIPGANHLFQKATTGSPMEYAALEKQFIDGLLGRVVGWLRKKVR